jgi:NhaP-type Na+/H+ or K+/H+ antiporter
MTEDILIKLAAIVVVGVGAQWLAWRFRIPSILLLLLAGIFIGPITEFVDPDELLGQLLIPIVLLSVGLILFEGGLTLRFADLPGVVGVVRNLITVGAAITWLVGTLFAWLLFDIDLSLAILFGAIIIVTGPTVIGPLLDHVRPTGRLGPILRWEGIIIDPIGAVLAVLVFEALLHDQLDEAAIDTVLAIVATVGIGTGIGLLGAGIMVLFLRRYWIPDALQNPVTLMLVIAAITLSDELQSESGLLAATVMGIVLANQKLVNVHHIVEFKENLRVLIIGGIFVILAARLTIDDITDFGIERAAFLVVLILLARPLAVAVSTLRSSLNWRERTFLAGMAPRGIVAAAIASIFALRLAEEGNADAPILVPLTFTVIIGTITVYGLGAGRLARLLNVSYPNPQGALIVGGQPWARRIAKALLDQDIPVLIMDSNRKNVADARMDGLPANYGNILADYQHGDLDLTGLGRILSMTPNDEVNALAGQRFLPIFGRANIYQLTPRGEGDARGASVPKEQRGRTLFGEGRSYGYLTKRFDHGAVVKTTELTEEFTYDDFLDRYGEDNVVPLFVINADKQMRVFAVEGNPSPKPGHTLISILDATEEDRKRDARKKEEREERQRDVEESTPAEP